MTLDDPEFAAGLGADAGPAKRSERLAVDPRAVAQAMRRQEFGHRLDTDRQPPRRVGMRNDLGKETVRVLPEHTLDSIVRQAFQPDMVRLGHHVPMVNLTYVRQEARLLQP